MDRLSFSDIIDENTEFIPLMTSDEEVEIGDDQLPELLPILPLRNTVIFPGVVAPITAGRDKSLRLIKSISDKDKFVGMVAQMDMETEDPSQSEVYPIGTMAQIVKSFQNARRQHDDHHPRKEAFPHPRMGSNRALQHRQGGVPS
jgi:ATP-dependent Lon protease